MIQIIIIFWGDIQLNQCLYMHISRDFSSTTLLVFNLLSIHQSQFCFLQSIRGEAKVGSDPDLPGLVNFVTSDAIMYNNVAVGVAYVSATSI